VNGFDRWDAVCDSFGELVPLYQCDGCKRWFHPGDTWVSTSDGEYCYSDHTGNGCIDTFVAACPHDEADVDLCDFGAYCMRCDSDLPLANA
jgi:hypothetical protein